MKQMQECLDRAFNQKSPLKKKWRAKVGKVEGTNVLALYHYHHLVFVYNLDDDLILHEWWEKPADKRGLDAAKEYLNRRKENDI